MAKPEKLEMLLWRGKRIEIRNDGQLVYEGGSLAATLRELSRFLQVSMTTGTQRQKPAKAVEKPRSLATTRGFFGRSIETASPFTPPPPAPLPEERLTSPRDRALMKVARGIPLSPEEEHALINSEQPL